MKIGDILDNMDQNAFEGAKKIAANSVVGRLISHNFLLKMVTVISLDKLLVTG